MSSMGNKRLLLIIVFLLYLAAGIPLIILEGRYTGLFIFLGVLLAGAVSSLSVKPEQTIAAGSADAAAQQEQSAAVSSNGETGLQDAPMSEAERNVFYGD